MFLKAKPMFLIAETSLHPGSGSDLGVVDLPIQRERHTNFPKIEGSGIKGSIRETIREKIGYKDKDKDLDLAFGPENPQGDEGHAGAIGFTDARILLFPVKSVQGVFAWITCNEVLNRFKKDLEMTGTNFNFNTIPVPDGTCVVSGSSTVKVGEQVLLEEYTFDIEKQKNINQISKDIANMVFDNNQNIEYFKNKMTNSIVLLTDDDFKDFVTMSTEVIARTNIDPVTGTVREGALWYEEYLPPDTVMYTLVLACPIFQKEESKKGSFQQKNINDPKQKAEKEAEAVLKFLNDNLPYIFQLGGNATLGKGLVRRTKLQGVN